MTSLTRPGHRDTGTQAVFGQVHPSWQQGGELAACPTMTKMSPCPWQEFSSKQAEDKQQSSYKIVFVQTIIFTVPSFKLEQNYQSSCFNPFLPRASQVYHPGKQSWNIGWSSPPLPGGSPQASPHSHTPHLKVQKVLSTPCQLPPGTCSWSVAVWWWSPLHCQVPLPPSVLCNLAVSLSSGNPTGLLHKGFCCFSC